MTTKQIKALDKSLARTNLKDKVWTFAQFRKQFGKIFPSLNNIDVSTYESGRIRAVPVYTDINKLLRKRGLTIKSVNYGRKYKVVDDPSKKVARQRTVVSRITASLNDLNLGLLAHGGIYSPMSTEEIEELSGESAYYPGHASY